MPGLPDSETKHGEHKKSSIANKYTQRPPTIVPNYGRKKQGLLPKSNISRVLLYDNVMQQQMLEIKLNNLKVEKRRSGRIFDLHRKSFMLRQSHKNNLLKNLTVVSENKTVLPAINNKDSDTFSSSSGSPFRKRNRSQSLPLIQPDVMTDVGVDSTLEQVPDEIENVERVNGISLPDIERNMAKVETRKANGITTSLLVRRERNVPDHQIVDQQSGAAIKEPSLEGINSDPLEIREESGLALSEPVSRSKKSSIVGDPRFQSLHRTLHKMDLPTEGFAELSPSFSRTYAKIPDYLTLM